MAEDLQGDDIVRAGHRLAASLRPGDLDATLSALTATAVDVLPEVDHASVTVLHADGQLVTQAATDELLVHLDKHQTMMGEGPCIAAAATMRVVLAPDLSTDQRFPRYAPEALAAGVRAQAGLPLFDSQGGHGALNFYSRNVGAFDDVEALGALFATQAAAALSYAREVEDLQRAVATREQIGKAIGIVMERFDLTDSRAFSFLARLSQHRNVKLRQVADEIVTAEDRALPS